MIALVAGTSYCRKMMQSISQILTTIGVGLSLFGTRTFKKAILRHLIRPFRQPQRKAGGSRAAITISAAGSGYALPSRQKNQTAIDHQLALVNAKIDHLFTRISEHGHHAMEREIAELRMQDDQTRDSITSSIERLAEQAIRADQWNALGLLLVLVGAALGFIDLIR